jgi:hypothetical protein
MAQPNEFVLSHDGNGKHYEEFCGTNEPDKLMDMIQRAFAGTLDGHVPVKGERYAGRLYGYKDRILLKLTRRKIRGPRR